MPRPFGTTGFASPSTVPPAVGPAGATYHDAAANLDFVSDGSAWAPISSLYVASRGSGLFANGQGLLGTNYNWVGYYNLTKTDHPVGAPASFQYSSSTGGLTLCNEFISIDPAGTYDMSFAFRQVTGDGARTFYSMLAPYDADKLAIGPNHYLEQANTRTTLAADLNPGATTITLASAANWNNAAGATSQLRNVIVWNYVDGQGYAWPAGTYSRNVVNNAYADGGISGNVITLSAPWSGSAAPAGTPISNGNSGGSYMYGAIAVLGPAAWTNYSYRYSGVHTNLQAPATTAFPAATSYVKLGFLHNYPTAPLDPTSLQRVGNINLTKVDLASGPAGGSLAGNYPNPTLAANSVGTTQVAAANKDGTAIVPSMRTLGTGALQAAAGNDARFTDARIPTGSAGGVLAGTYPSPRQALPTVVSGLGSWITSQTNWNVTGASYALSGNILSFTLSATNTGAAINTGVAGGTGDIGNTDIAQLNLAIMGITSLPLTQYLSSGPTGRMYSAVINTVGMVTIAATVPGTDIANGGTLTLGGTVIVTPV